jgi:hypothetical protein
MILVGVELVAIVRFLHIAFATVWLGGAVMMNVGVLPALRRDRDMLRRFMGRFAHRTMLVMEVAGAGTLLFGLWLYHLLWGIGSLFGFASGHDAAFFVAFTIAMVLFLSGVATLLGMQAKMERLLRASEGGPPPPEFERMVKAMPVMGAVFLLLMFTVLAIMVAGTAGVFS